MFVDPATLVWCLLCWGLFSALAEAPRPGKSAAAQARAQATWERRVARGARSVARRQARASDWRQHEALTKTAGKPLA